MENVIAAALASLTDDYGLTVECQTPYSAESEGVYFAHVYDIGPGQYDGFGLVELLAECTGDREAYLKGLPLAL